MSSLKGTTCSCLILREKDKVTHMCHGTVANLTAKQQEIKAKLRQFVIKTRELKQKEKKKKNATVEEGFFVVCLGEKQQMKWLPLLPLLL